MVFRNIPDVALFCERALGVAQFVEQIVGRERCHIRESMNLAFEVENIGALCGIEIISHSNLSFLMVAVVRAGRAFTRLAGPLLYTLICESRPYQFAGR